MEFFEFRTDSFVDFNSIHSIDNVEWKPKVKLLTDFDIIFAQDHKVGLLCDSQNYTINQNEAFLAYPGQSVYIYPDVYPRTGVTVLHFSVQRYCKKNLNEVMEIFKNQPSGPKHRIYLSTHLKLRNDLVHATLRTMFNELKYRRFGYEEMLNLCLHGLLYELHRTCAEDIVYGNVEYNYRINNIYATKIIDFLHNNYMNEITATDITEHLEISYDYSNVVFKRITGFTIMNYLNNIRIARAKELIKSTSLSIQEISNIVGIKDPHYFSKKFKALEGVSPSQYKRS